MAEMEGDHPEEREKRADGGMVRRGRRARGGKSGEHVQEYNAQGSEAVKAADDEEDGFHKGGRAKRKEGGHTEGHEARRRHDREHRGRHAAGGATAAPAPTALKRGGHAMEEREEEREEEKREHDAAGGRTRRAAGGSVPAPRRLARGGGSGHTPFSSGRALSPPKTGDAAQRGMEGQKVGPEMD
jgi:hypothetical protein